VGDYKLSNECKSINESKSSSDSIICESYLNFSDTSLCAKRKSVKLRENITDLLKGIFTEDSKENRDLCKRSDVINKCILRSFNRYFKTLFPMSLKRNGLSEEVFSTLITSEDEAFFKNQDSNCK
jgi:hypothetical protein